MIATILPLADFTAPKIEYNELAPLLVVFGAACVGVLVEAFLPRPLRHLVQLAIAVVALVAAGVLSGILLADKKELIAAQGEISVDGPALFTWLLLLALTLISAAVRRAVGRQCSPRSRARRLPYRGPRPSVRARRPRSSTPRSFR